MEEGKRTLIEVILGIWILALLVILGGVFFVERKLAYVLGELVGSLTASLVMVWLYESIALEMDLDKKGAVGHARLQAALRVLVETAVLAGSFYIAEWVMPFTVLSGLFGRKFAPFLVPLMEHIRKKRSGEIEETENSAE